MSKKRTFSFRSWHFFDSFFRTFFEGSAEVRQAHAGREPSGTILKYGDQDTALKGETEP